MMTASSFDVNQIAVFAYETLGKTEKIKTFCYVKKSVFDDAGAGGKFILVIQGADLFPNVP